MQNLPDASEIAEAHKQGLHKELKELNVTGAFQEGKINAYISILNDLYGEFDNSIGSWLDVGCGHGEFIVALDQFSQHALSVEGTEPNIHKQKSARARNLNVAYFDLASHDKKYDGAHLI